MTENNDDEVLPVLYIAKQIVCNNLINKFNDLNFLSSSNIDVSDIKRDYIDLAVYIKTDINLHVTTTDNHVSSIWNDIRKSEHAVALLLSLSSELTLTLMNEGVYDDLIRCISTGYGNLATEQSGIDETLLKSLGFSVQLEELIMANKWLVPLYVISHCSFEELGVKAASNGK